jgi:hypothetical protein
MFTASYYQIFKLNAAAIAIRVQNIQVAKITA